MKTKLTFLTILLLFIVGNISAQEIKYPLEAKVQKEDVPTSPGEDFVWVKGHYEYAGGKYTWVDGKFTPKREGHKWMDGYWERNQKTGWWVFNEGYWQKENNDLEVRSDNKVVSISKSEGTPQEEVVVKPTGLFIKTTSTATSPTSDSIQN